MKGKFDRLLRILNILDRRSTCTASWLAEELEVTERSIFRYVGSLRHAGFPIVYDKERRTYAFNNDFKLKKARLNVDETLALAISRRMLSPLGATFERAFDSLERKVLDVSSPCGGLPQTSTVVVAIGDMGEKLDISKLLKALTKACGERRLVHMSYVSLHSRKNTSRDVEPYYLFFTPDGFWNLRGYCRLRDGWRTFALDRVKAWQVLDRTFLPKILADDVGRQLSKGFGSYLDGEPVKVVVRFSQAIRPYVERRIWHPTQEVRETSDGCIEVRFVTTGIEAVKFWLYRWIPHVRVVEPEELRVEMIGELRLQVRELEEVDSRVSKEG